MPAVLAPPTPRWTLLRPHAEQSRYFFANDRLAVLLKGRRSGGTELSKRKGVIRALRESKLPDFRANFCAPTRDQAKQIFWDDLKALTPEKYWARDPMESELVISLVNGATLRVVGMDRPQRMDGRPQDWILADEFADTKPEALDHTLLPCIGTTGRPGQLTLCGRAKVGAEHFKAVVDKAMEPDSDWKLYGWRSDEIITQAEQDFWRRTLHPLAYAVEIENRWANPDGAAYYTFERTVHAKEPIRALAYNKRGPLIVALDFNVDPGVAAIGQEWRPEPKWLATRPHLAESLIAWFGEVHIKGGSNTPAVCRKIIEDWGKHEGDLLLYGDATGGRRSTQNESGEPGGDWAMVRRYLEPAFPGRVRFRVERGNPFEKDRVNAVVARFRTADGKVHMLVDPACKYLADDFEGTSVLPGSAGELDKHGNPERTHGSDAAGYYVAAAYPLDDGEAKVEEF